MRIIAEKEGVPYCKGDQPTVGHILVLQPQEGQVLGTPINVMVVIIVGLQGQPAEGFALVQPPQGQDERKAKAGTMRQEVVEAHAMAQITLDLERGGPALRRGDKGDQETTKKRRRQSRRRRPGGSKCEVGAGGKGGLVCQRARGCTYMAEPHVALGESWLVHLYGEAARFFFFSPTPRWSRCTYMGKPLSRVGEQYCLVCGMTNQQIKRGVGRGGLACGVAGDREAYLYLYLYSCEYLVGLQWRL